MPAEVISDEELLRRYQAGQGNRWLGMLLDRYSLLAFGVAMKYLKNAADAEDATQQVFLKALSNLPQEAVRNFKGWLYIVLRNHCLQILRDRKPIQAMPEDPLLPAPTDDRKGAILKNATLEELHEGMATLPNDQRICLDAFYLQRRSYAEICEAYTYTFAQVKSFIQNGKRNLKNYLATRFEHLRQ